MIHGVGLSALLVSTNRAMREPIDRGTSDKDWLHVFFVSICQPEFSRGCFGAVAVNLIVMPIFQITTKNRRNVNGILIEPGMTVQVVSQSIAGCLNICDLQENNR